MAENSHALCRFNKDTPTTAKEYIMGHWNMNTQSCLGIMHDNGLFEYMDIHTNKSILYQLCKLNNKIEPISLPWLDFKFHYSNSIIFVLQNKVFHGIFATKKEIRYGFPNNIGNINENNTLLNANLLIETQGNIQSFTIDFQSKLLYIGMINGDLLILTLNNDNSTKVFKSIHASSVTSLHALNNAIVTGGCDQTFNIYDVSTKNNTIDITLYQKFDIQTSRITIIHAFRNMNNKQLLCVGTAEGIVFIYSLANLQLIAILELDSQSEVLTISTMKNGEIICIGQLNGKIALFLTDDTFDCIGTEKFNNNPVVMAHYNTNSKNDFTIIHSNGLIKYFPSTPSSSDKSSLTISNINTASNGTIKDDDMDSKQSESVLSNTTVGSSKPYWKQNARKTVVSTNQSSSMYAQTPKTRQNENNKRLKDISNLVIKQTVHKDYNKVKNILKQMDSNIESKSEYAKAKPGDTIEYYTHKINEIENKEFDVNDENIKKIINKNTKSIMNKKKGFHIDETTDKYNYNEMPNIKSINLKDNIDNNIKYMKQKRVQQSNKVIQNNVSSPQFEPSLTPFFKPSLQPQHRHNYDVKISKWENTYANSTYLQDKLHYWTETTFNQC